MISRLPFAVVKTYGLLTTEPRIVKTVTNEDVCFICGALVVVASAIFGAIAGLYCLPIHF